jgi:hypothetical protein
VLIQKAELLPCPLVACLYGLSAFIDRMNAEERT